MHNLNQPHPNYGEMPDIQQLEFELFEVDPDTMVIDYFRKAKLIRELNLMDNIDLLGQ